MSYITDILHGISAAAITIGLAFLGFRIYDFVREVNFLLIRVDALESNLRELKYEVHGYDKRIQAMERHIEKRNSNA